MKKILSNPMAITAMFTGGFGLLLSILISVLSGANITTILIRSLVSGCITGVMGAGAVLALQFLMPEFFQQISKKSSAQKSAKSDEEDDEDLDDEDISVEDLDTPVDSEMDEYSLPEPVQAEENIEIDENQIREKKKAKTGQKRSAKDGEFMVGEIPLKDDPALMAEAVRHVLDDDED